MKNRRYPARMAVALGAALLGTAFARAAEPLMSYATPMRDISLNSVVESRNMDALKKISNEFAQSYRFASSQMWYKEPDMFRVDSKAGVISVKYVINGNTKVLKAGPINKRWDITGESGQRQTALTVGLLTPAWINSVNATPKGKKTISGRESVVFDAHFKGEKWATWHRLYMDPEKRFVLRSEQYRSGGELKNTIVFSDPVKVNGVWVPTRTKVFNPQGELGAVTRMENIKVNTGLPSSLFAL